MQNIKEKAREMFDEKFKCIQIDCDGTGCIPVAKEVPRQISDNPDEYAIDVELEAEQCQFHAEYIFPIQDFIDQIIDLAIAERDKEIAGMILKKAKEDYVGSNSLLYIDDKAITDIIYLINNTKTVKQ